MAAALRVQPRVYPAGRALSLVAVGGLDLAGKRFTVEGRRVQGVRFGRLALAIAYVDPVEYAEDGIARNRERAAWVSTEARVHERAVTKAGTFAPVIPAPLLGVFPDPLAFEAAAAERYPRWSRALTRVGLQREYALHVRCGPHATPGAEPYLLRVVARLVRSGKAVAAHPDPRIAEHGEALVAAAGASNVRRIATENPRREPLGAVLLLDDARAEAARSAIAALAPAGAALGLTCYFEGPRPAFSFV